MHAKTDALTRRSSNRSKLEDDNRQRHQHQLLLTSNKLNLRIRDEMNIIEISEKEKNKKDSNQSATQITSKSISKSEEDALKEKIFLSENQRLQIIKEIHDQSAIEHSRIRRILKMMKRFFY
jgi:hypothetical protein